MTRFKVKLDGKGVGEFLKSSDVASAINNLTSEIAAGAGAQAHMPTETSMETIDRARGTVTVQGEDAAALVVRDGLLINQAKGLGLDFRSHAQKVSRQKQKRKAELGAARRKAAQ